MKPHALICLAAALVLTSLAGCGAAAKAPAAARETVGVSPPGAPLPSDLAGVSGIATAAVAKGEKPSGTAAPAAESDGGAATGGRIAATGELVSPIRSELAVRLPGRVGKVFVQEGARVRRGQPVLEIETDYFRLDLQRSEADLARAHATTLDAERDLARKKELIAKGSVSQAAYDRSSSAFEVARAGEQSIVAARDLARQRLADAVLRSPIDGVVAEKRTDVGQRMGDNSVAFVIAQTSPLKLRFKLPERYLAAIRRGQEVVATVDPYPGESFRGRVTVVGGVVDSTTRSFNVECELANRDGRLSPGLFARVEIQVGPAGAGKPGGGR